MNYRKKICSLTPNSHDVDSSTSAPLSIDSASTSSSLHRRSTLFRKRKEKCESSYSTPRSTSTSGRSCVPMDFLSTYFPSTPLRRARNRTNSQHNAESSTQAGTVRGQDGNELNNKESPTSIITDETVTQPQQAEQMDGLVNATTENSSNHISNNRPPNYLQNDELQQQSNEVNSSSLQVNTLSPLSRQYALLRRVRRHYSDTDVDTMKTITKERKRGNDHGDKDDDDNINNYCERDIDAGRNVNSVHFLSPLDEDIDSLHTIKLTPKQMTNLSTKSPIARFQSFDDSQFSPTYYEHHQQKSNNLINHRTENSAASKRSPTIKGWMNVTKQKQKTKNKEYDKEKDKDNTKQNKEKQRDDNDKEATFNFFGIKFRRQAS